MKSVYHRADSRGLTKWDGFLSWHTFSFLNYYDKDRISFGTLRALNEDILAPGHGLERCSHRNMVIITLPLYGVSTYRDNLGNVAEIGENDIQVVSAGSGIQYGLSNPDGDRASGYIQVWLLPSTRNSDPSYFHGPLKLGPERNALQRILFPDGAHGTYTSFVKPSLFKGIWRAGQKIVYTPKVGGYGTYFFVVEGQIRIGEQEINARDGYGIWEVVSIPIQVLQDAEVLVIEVPMAATQEIEP